MLDGQETPTEAISEGERLTTVIIECFNMKESCLREIRMKWEIII